MPSSSERGRPQPRSTPTRPPLPALVPAPVLTLQPLQLVLSRLQQAASLIPQLLCTHLRSQHPLGLALSQGLHCLVLVAQWALQQLGMWRAGAGWWPSGDPASTLPPRGLCLSLPAQPPWHDPGHCLLFLRPWRLPGCSLLVSISEPPGGHSVAEPVALQSSAPALLPPSSPAPAVGG